MIQNFSLPTSNPAPPTPTEPQSPSWADFAHTVIDRLILNHGGRDPGDTAADTGCLDADLLSWDDANLAPGDQVLPFDGTEDTGTDGGDPTGMSKATPAFRLSARELTAALRLATTFQTEEAFLARLVGRAVTILDGLAPDDLGWITSALDKGLAPLDWRVSGTMSRPGDTQVAIILKPDVSDGEVSRTAARAFQKRLEEGLATGVALFVLCPAGTGLPETWRAALPAPLTLAPLSQDMLLLQLAHSHPFDPCEAPQIREALPSDRTLARLPAPPLQVALRETSALTVARRLSDLAHGGQAPGLRLSDLAGYGRAKAVALGIVDDLAVWAQGDLPWSHVCRGLLLSGPPGCGKTELARSMAREGGLTFVSGSFAAWQKEGHLGDFLKAMHADFTAAINGAPSILFIDELDAFSSRDRDAGTSNASYGSKAIAGLLEHLDGVASREGVVVIAATNHVDHIDPALIRSGRIDEHVIIDLPSRDDLAVILRQHLQADLPDANLPRLAAAAIGRSGADIAGAVRTARARARQGRRAFHEEDLAAVLSPVWQVASPALEWRTALHEAGHAVVTSALGTGTPVCLRIDATGGACILEMTAVPVTADDFHRERTTDLAGRAAEQLVLGSISRGAGGPRTSDLARVTLSVLHEEMTFGLGSLGSLWLHADPTPLDSLRLPPAVQQHLRHRIRQAEDNAGEILRQNRTVLEGLAGPCARHGW